jgi:hypothetical protein
MNSQSGWRQLKGAVGARNWRGSEAAMAAEKQGAQSPQRDNRRKWAKTG